MTDRFCAKSTLPSSPPTELFLQKYNWIGSPWCTPAPLSQWQLLTDCGQRLLSAPISSAVFLTMVIFFFFNISHQPYDTALLKPLHWSNGKREAGVGTGFCSSPNCWHFFPLFCSFCHSARPFCLLTVSVMVSVQELCVSRLYLGRYPVDVNTVSVVDS